MWVVAMILVPRLLCQCRSGQECHPDNQEALLRETTLCRKVEKWRAQHPADNRGCRFQRQWRDYLSQTLRRDAERDFYQPRKQRRSRTKRRHRTQVSGDECEWVEVAEQRQESQLQLSQPQDPHQQNSSTGRKNAMSLLRCSRFELHAEPEPVQQPPIWNPLK